MIAAIAVVCVLLLVLFLVAAVAGNRAQTRMVAEQAEADRRRANRTTTEQGISEQ